MVSKCVEFSFRLFLSYPYVFISIKTFSQINVIENYELIYFLTCCIRATLIESQSNSIMVLHEFGLSKVL